MRKYHAQTVATLYNLAEEFDLTSDYYLQVYRQLYDAFNNLKNDAILRSYSDHDDFLTLINETAQLDYQFWLDDHPVFIFELRRYLERRVKHPPPYQMLIKVEGVLKWMKLDIEQMKHQTKKIKALQLEKVGLL